MIDRFEASTEPKAAFSRRRQSAVGLVLVAILGIAGCTKDDKAGEKPTESAQKAVRFVEVSEGLPTKGQWRERVTVGDLDGDGRPEIVAPPARATQANHSFPKIWSREGDKEWKEWTVPFPEWPYRYGDVALADFDRDGKLDIAIASHMQGVAVLLNRGERRFELSNDNVPLPGKFQTRSLAAADFDGDGYADIVAPAEVSKPDATNLLGLMFLRNKEGKTWERDLVAGLEPVFAKRVKADDLDGDGRADVILGSLRESFSQLTWKLADGKFEPLGTGLPENNLASGADSCARRDGIREIAITTERAGDTENLGPRVFRLDGGEWKAASDGLPSSAARDVALGDWSRDGSCDLAVGDFDSNAVKLFRRNEAGAWRAWTEMPMPEGLGRIASVQALDVDGDEHLDLIATYSWSGTESGEGNGGIRAWLTRD